MMVVALRYLATGTQFRSLAFSFRLGRSTVGAICRAVCKALWTELHDELVSMPTTEDGWMLMADQFWRKTQFPNLLG
jgi:hypothetical protein